jgi:AcrR family transcriptional regulator
MDRSTTEEGVRAGRGGRTGRPPLTERRKAATRLEIAREAVRLFTTRGIARTSAEDIADAAGISVRTLWRYFPSKERCVLPLLTAGIETAARCLRAWPPDQGITALLDCMQRATGEAVTDMPTLLGLVRLTRTEPGLRAVWMQAHDDAEPVFAAALAERAAAPADGLDIRVQAATLNAALRAAVEHHAWHGPPPDRPDAGYGQLIEAIRTALLTAARGLPL